MKIKRLLQKIMENKWMLRSLPSSIYFNFHYLPINQAIKLPIILYKPHFIKCSGRIYIKGSVKFGMIQLGKPMVSIFPNNGIIWDNKGCISFLGNAHIGNNSSISTGNTGMIEFGNNFRATTTVRIIS